MNGTNEAKNGGSVRTWLMLTVLLAVGTGVFLLMRQVPDNTAEIEAPEPSRPASATQETEISTREPEVAGESVQLAQSGIELHDGRLTVALDQVPLRDAMAELSELTGIDIRVKPMVEELALTHHFSDVPVEQGIQTLLRDTNSMFVYAEVDKSQQITQIIILGESTEESALPPLQPDFASTIEQLRSLTDNQNQQILEDLSKQVTEQLQQVLPGLPGDLLPESGTPVKLNVPSVEETTALLEQLGQQISEQIGQTLPSLMSDQEGIDPALTPYGIIRAQEALQTQSDGQIDSAEESN